MTTTDKPIDPGFRAKAYDRAQQLMDPEATHDEIARAVDFMLGETPAIDPAGLDRVGRLLSNDLGYAWPVIRAPKLRDEIVGSAYDAIVAYLGTEDRDRDRDDDDLDLRSAIFELAQARSRPGATVADVLRLAEYLMTGTEGIDPTRVKRVARHLLGNGVSTPDAFERLTGRAYAIVTAYLKD